MKKSKDDYYELLGITKESDEETIKKAYRKKALQYHPDKNPGDKKAEDMFKKISEAYEILSDPNKKQQYDNGGDLNSFFSNSQDIFANFFGNRGFNFSFNDSAFQSPAIPADTKVMYRASLQEIISGSQIEIHLKRIKSCDKCFGHGRKNTNEKCSVCNGQKTKTVVIGNMMMSATCDACSGTGKKTEVCVHCKGAGGTMVMENISLTVPYGINPLTTLRLQGKGNETYINGQKTVGDAYIVIDYPLTYKGVTLQNGDIYASIKVPFTSALNEDEITVDILGCKNINFRLDSSYLSGHFYKIEHAGIKQHNNAHIKVFIDFPKNKISEENRQKLIKITREIYGESNNKFKPEFASSDNNRRS